MKAVTKCDVKKRKHSQCSISCLCKSNRHDDIDHKPSDHSYVVLSECLTRLPGSEHEGALRILHQMGGSCTTDKLDDLQLRWH